jgi:hypothetical protein|tara:strand:- start:122 stop:250 length:129 start_codon:yes stop_codon:yes gene_type:complete
MLSRMDLMTPCYIGYFFNTATASNSQEIINERPPKGVRMPNQ